MSPQTRDITSFAPEDTARLALKIGSSLRAGDTILLSGGIGAGKTHFARALIQSLLGTPEDVPSPTFTLVQVYDSPKAEIWHSDLYRLTDPDQCIELGLIDAFETAISLVEWPENMGDLAPADALHLHFSMDAAENTRHIRAIWTALKWSPVLEGLPA